jgi:putative photosynthetic complex assembly protein 2
MNHYVYPILFALFVWWFSTGAIIFLDNLPRKTFRYSMIGATLVFAASAYGLAASSGDVSLRGAYVAFTFGMFAWGWQEISFYMGFVTGPRKQACPEGCSGWAHFGHAIQTSLWHELAIIGSAAIIVALTWGQPNQIGTWTFMVLWWMHQSAKLNVFLGVRNLNEEFLPEHLGFLKGFLTKKPMNLLFPISVTVSTVICVYLVQAARAPGATAFAASGFTFLATMMGLAILEHWFLVLPLPAAKLWHWGLRSRAVRQPFDAEIVVGFLGAGKTTYMRRLLAAADPDVKTVVLVNDFGSVGVDGSLLSGRGAEVVELPNGCICCSLRKDLAAQLIETIERWAPRRVLIEPSGVADVASLLAVLNQPDVRPLLRSQTVCTVIDAGAFLRDFARMPEYFEAQAALAPTLIVNKTDLASPAELSMITTTLRAINPAAAILAATYGVVREAPAVPAPVAAAVAHSHSEHHHHDHAEHHDHDHHEVALGLQSWSSALAGPCDPQDLHALLQAVVVGDYGEVDRVKGLTRAGGGWIHFDVAGGRSSMAAFAPRDGEQPRVVAIGRSVDRARLQAAFAACMAPAAA